MLERTRAAAALPFFLVMLLIGGTKVGDIYDRWFTALADWGERLCDRRRKRIAERMRRRALRQ